MWSLINADVLKSEKTETGWKMQDGVIVPIMDTAPESLLRIVGYKCEVCDDLDLKLMNSKEGTLNSCKI